MVIDKLSGIPVRGGVAKNDTMLRVDVFRHKKDGKVSSGARVCASRGGEGVAESGGSWRSRMRTSGRLSITGFRFLFLTFTPTT
ncbi:MAG: hypothetical protein U5L03_04325 [Burkholderiaceae bacterium]|nr:hypothetical protein [Burkholderiaceae bacterium]